MRGRLLIPSTASVRGIDGHLERTPRTVAKGPLVDPPKRVQFRPRRSPAWTADSPRDKGCGPTDHFGSRPSAASAALSLRLKIHLAGGKRLHGLVINSDLVTVEEPAPCEPRVIVREGRSVVAVWGHGSSPSAIRLSLRSRSWCSLADSCWIGDEDSRAPHRCEVHP